MRFFTAASCWNMFVTFVEICSFRFSKPHINLTRILLCSLSSAICCKWTCRSHWSLGGAARLQLLPHVLWKAITPSCNLRCLILNLTPSPCCHLVTFIVGVGVIHYFCAFLWVMLDQTSCRKQNKPPLSLKRVVFLWLCNWFIVSAFLKERVSSID